MTSDAEDLLTLLRAYNSTDPAPLPAPEPASTFKVGEAGTQKLMTYWAHGEGAAKIRWGTDGSFDRCVRHLRKYFPRDPKGLCANLHHKATGQWPTEGGKAGIPS